MYLENKNIFKLMNVFNAYLIAETVDMILMVITV